MKRGCPFGTIGNEVTENDELIRQDLSLIFEIVKNKLAAFFLKEKAKGDSPKMPTKSGWRIFVSPQYRVQCCWVR